MHAGQPCNGKLGLFAALLFAPYWSPALCQPRPASVTVTGRVTDAKTGKPIASVEVHLYPRAGGSGQGTVPRRLAVTSDELGRFSLDGVPTGKYRASVRHNSNDYRALSREVEVGKRSREFTFEMNPWLRLRGRLLGPNGNPVDRKKGHVYAVGTGEHGGSSIHAYPTFRTEWGGSFTARLAEPATYRLFVLVENVGSAQTEVVVRGGEPTELGSLTLQPLVAVAGTVTEVATGRAVANARLRATRDRSASADAPSVSVTSQPTDADGRFTLSLPEGTWRVSEESPSLSQRDSVRVVTTRGRQAPPVHLQVTRLAKVHGSLFDHHGQPVVAVRLSAVLAGARAARDGSASAISSPEGRFELYLAPVGKTRLVVRAASLVDASRGLGWWESPEVNLSVAEETSLDIHLRPGGALSGLVLDPEGNPVGGVSVTSRLWGAWSMNTKADPAGRFRFAGVLPGLYSVSAASSAYSTFGSSAAAVEDGAETARVALPVRRVDPLGPVTVRGMILLPDGRTRAAEASVGVFVLRPSTPPQRRGPLVRAGPDGTFEIEFTPRRDWEREALLVARLEGYGFGTSKTYALEDRTSLDEVVVRLQLPGTVEGQAVSTDGAPLVDVVAAAAPSRWPLRSVDLRRVPLYCRAVATDAQGRFQLTDLAPEPHRVVVCREQRIVAVSDEPVRVQPQGSVAGLRVQQPPFGGALEGRVIDVGGEALADARVFAERVFPPSPPYTLGSGRFSMSADISGRFCFEELPPGVYGVSASLNGYAREGPVEVEVAEGAPPTPVTVWLRERPESERRIATVRGVVFLPDGQTTAANVLARLYYDGNEVPYPAGCMVLTDAKGAFEIKRWHDGAKRKALVIAGRSDHGYGTSRSFWLQDEEAVEGVSVTLRHAARVEGVVVEADGSPAPRVKIAATPPEWPLWYLDPDTISLRLRSTTADEQGRFRIEGVAPETVQIVAHRTQGIASAASEPLNLQPRQVISGLKLRMPPAVGSLSGRILIEGTEQPVPDASLSLSSEHVHLYHGLPGASCRTDDDGRYSFTGLPPGTYTLYARTGGLAGRGVQDIQITDDDPDATLDIQLSRGGKLSGTVLDEGGEPIRGAFVSTGSLRRGEYSPTGTGPTEAIAATSSRGTFWLRLAPGEYSLRIAHREFETTTREVSVREGEESEITVTLKALEGAAVPQHQ